MSLPTVTGRGFLLSEGIELKYSQAGNAWARVPLAFKNRRSDGQGGWTHDKEIVLQGKVFGALAEFLADNVDGRQDIEVSGELYLETWEKDGETRTAVALNILSANPIARRERVSVSVPRRTDDDSDDSIPF